MNKHPDKNPAADDIGKRLSEDGSRILREPSTSLREKTLSTVCRIDKVCEVTSNQTTSYLLPRIRIALGAAAIITVGIVSVLLIKGETTVTDEVDIVANNNESSEISKSMSKLFAMTIPREEDLIEQTLVKEFKTYALAGREFFDDAMSYLPPSIRKQSEEDM